MDITDYQNGYHRARGVLACNYCDFTASDVDAVSQHLDAAHGGALAALLADPAKHNSLTVKQQALMTAFAAGTSDKAIAAATGVTLSTVRHQRFTFRQKAAQARLYLAQYQAVFGEQVSPVLALPAAASQFALTEADSQQILHKLVDFSGNTPTLRRWPKQEKQRVCLCARIYEDFPQDQRLSGAATKTLLSRWWPDHSQLARYLVDYGFLARTADGREYWRIFA